MMMTQSKATNAPGTSWNQASCLTRMDGTYGLQVADSITRLLLFRKVRRQMTNVQYIAYCASHAVITDGA